MTTFIIQSESFLTTATLEPTLRELRKWRLYMPCKNPGPLPRNLNQVAIYDRAEAMTLLASLSISTAITTVTETKPILSHSIGIMGSMRKIHCMVGR